jgi:hypothetical protein
LLVPGRLVRALPWINYDDFLTSEFKAYLTAKRTVARQSVHKLASETRGKSEVITVTRGDISLVERYVRSREQQSSEARPSIDYIDEDACREADRLKEKLKTTPTGREHAGAYQELVLEILNYLFNPELIDGQPEVRTFERRDIIFTNDSDESFWDYVRTAHDGIFIMFEAKNTDDLDMPEINQTSTYLGDRIGRLGVIVTRQSPRDSVLRKIFSVWNDSAPNRKVILTLTDEQLREMLDLRCNDGSPTKWMQKHYRTFRTSVQ